MNRDETKEIVIEAATPADVRAIAMLLREAELPSEDFAGHLDWFLVARSSGELVGAIGAEVSGGDALLRSLVVAPAARGAGVGGALVRRLEAAAGEWGVRRWWLLTTTAEAFFRKRGFEVTPRSAAPPAIAATKEFAELCPSVATCLSRERRTP
jgi:N-acetylglutamate synthase-like GNAT family acetyltransferase